MGKPRRRTAAVLVYAISIAVSLLTVSGAFANVFPTLNTGLTQGQTDIDDSGVFDVIDTSGETNDRRLAAHSDFSVDLSFSYGATGLTGSGTENPQTYPPGTDYRETIKNLVVEIPPGLAGNPNAIPYAERCDEAVFLDLAQECPDSATVGEVWLKYSLMHTPANPTALNIIPIGPIWRSTYTGPGAGFTKVSLIKTDPEVPAKIGVYVKGPVNIGNVRVILEINPVTTEDLRLRTITASEIPSQVWNGNLDEWEDVRIERMRIKLYGKLASGRAFMTNPASCQPWTTKAWAQAHYGNSNATENPLGGAPDWVAVNASTLDPDCSNAAQVPFNAKGTVSISSDKRDVAPDFDFVIDNPGMYDDNNAASGPRKIVTRVPAAINVDVQQLSRTCEEALFNADKCPSTTKVGSVKIETPLLTAGLTGDVFLVRKPQAGLPDLGLRVRGAITFTQRGSNRYVGVKGNEIETTFDNIPQLGFTKLTFHLDGGPNGLLRTLACPTGNKQPAVGAFTYDFTAWSGATTSSTTKLNAANCFGIQKLKRFKCVYRVLRFQPVYTSRARVKRVDLRVRGRKVATIRQNKEGTSKLGFKVPAKKLKRLKKGTHKFEVAATYDDGTVSKKRSKFKKC